jgi:bacillithiol biosynthesis cysteine-adding enzyme BshC
VSGVEGSVRFERLMPDRAPAAGAFPEALRAGDGAACGFLPAIPRSEAAWRAALLDAAQASAPVPDALAEVLAERQRLLGAGPRAEAAARALARPGTVAVVAGQQPGLLGGLLLAFHKAAGAVNLALRLDGTGGVRVVPVFWLASEDHDLDEANRAILLDRTGRPRRLRLDRRVDGRSLMHLPIDAAEVETFRAEVASLLPDTDRAREALALLDVVEGDDLATWCVRAFTGILGDAGLVVVEPPQLLPYAGDAFAGLLERATPIADALRLAGRALTAAKLPAPLDPPAGYVPLFVRDEAVGVRRRVRLDPHGRVRVDGTDETYDVGAFAARLRAHPELGSGDVVGRVFLQDRLLPVFAAFGGPTELAYHAQVRAAHAAVGLRYPLALPRPEATWVDVRSERTAEAFGSTVADLLAAGVARPPAPTDAPIDDDVEQWRERVLAVPASLGARGGEVERALARARKRLGDLFVKVEKDLRGAADRDRGIGSDRWDRLEAQLRPRGKPQERGLSALSVVARQGVETFRDGLSGLDPLAPGHHVLHTG